MRLKTLEDGLKNESINTYKPNQIIGTFSGKAAERKRSSSQQCASRAFPSPLNWTNSFRTDASTQDYSTEIKSAETVQKENRQENSGIQLCKFTDDDGVASTGIDAKQSENKASKVNRNKISDGQDMVSGLLYDRLQEEVINLRKLSEARESLLSSKYEEIKILTRKVIAMTKRIEVESRKMKREIMARQNEVVLPKSDHNRRYRNLSISKRFTKTPV